MGIAVGGIGLSVADFCGLQFDEFAAIHHAWQECQMHSERADWERTRTLAAITIQPHVKKRLTPRQLMPLPWDKAKPGGGHTAKDAEVSTPARRASVAARLGVPYKLS